MTTASDLTGIHVPLVTPFTADGTVAADALAGLAHSALDAGAAGIVALGTTGEAAALDAAERRTVLDVCGAVCRERGAPLTVGTGSSDTRATAEALRALERDAPDASYALVPVPPYTRPAEDGVVAHFAHVAGHSPVPVLVYHIPYRTGCALSAAALRRLAGVPGVAGTKLALGGVDGTAVDLLADPPAGFAVLGGDDLFVSPLLALGAPGGILAAAHLRTARWAELAAAWRAGEADRARALTGPLVRLARALFAEPNPAVTKAVLHAQGRLPSPAVRLPLLPAGDAAVRAALEAYEAAA
ncbi:dihydrodipicolinate synthase family protein [Streptomyces boncukensis]|uniref:4-hydroxy-tetrahydrodipicolinate synthase n=1 Tax=Streptomyces boncukensis TaxID=2711219 RepID=A0A6G4WT41_9ACTN|nr:dihydrodipicolinate synthase family protein [Streptomyces boncukensis]NGO67714.1 4-hydroxy-tetrahydrodipicolinate synthase [Streptomyces boncukensis]